MTGGTSQHIYLFAYRRYGKLDGKLPLLARIMDGKQPLLASSWFFPSFRFWFRVPPPWDMDEETASKCPPSRDRHFVDGKGEAALVVCVCLKSTATKKNIC